MLRFVFPFVAIALLQPICAFSLDSDRDQPAIIDAQEIEIDFGTGRRIYRGEVTIRQGTLQVVADQIELFFNDGRLELAIAQGQPAIFRQQPEGSEYQIIGRGRQIVINEIENIATFTGDALLQQHLDTITGETITYHMRTERMTVRGSDGAPSRTTRLSKSETSKNMVGDASDEITRPRIVIQSERDPTPKIQNPEPLQPSVPLTSVGETKITKTGPTTPTSTDGANTKSSVIHTFSAARVGSAGTGVYNSSSLDAEVLGGLSSGIPVKILAVHKEWARVEIPSGVSVWVFGIYVIENEGRGQINGQGVRARWLPASDSRIVGIFQPGDRVRVLATRGNWKQVSLPPSIPAWVPTRQLEMLSYISSAWWSEWAAYAGPLPGDKH